MQVPLVFNELSVVSNVSASKLDGYQHLSEMLTAIRLATSKGMSGGVLGFRQWWPSITLAPDYPVSRWLDDREVSKDEKTYLLRQADKDPQAPMYQPPDCCEVTFNGGTADGLGRAYLSDLMAVSIRSNDTWDSPELPITVTKLESQGLEVTASKVHNASCSEHVSSNDVWIRQRLGDALPTAVPDLEAWVHESLLNLVFCENWMEKVKKSPDMVRTVAVELAKLQVYVAEHGRESFDLSQCPYPGQTSVDSAATLQEFGGDRTFLCPDGERRTFSQHLKLRHTWRIYVYVLPDSGLCCVGYAGPHLPTVNDPS